MVNNCNEAVVKNLSNMYTEAFLFVGNLLQDGKIEEVRFLKSGFRVRFKGEKGWFDYPYTETGIISFLELYETY